MFVYDKILDWATERNLIDGSDPKTQLLKTMSELGELADAINEGDRVGQIDGIGDVVVTLVIVAAQLGFDFEDCVVEAYNQIKDRKGKTVDGVFIKEI